MVISLTIDYFQEKLYEDLTDYVAYRELSAEEPPKEQEIRSMKRVSAQCVVFRMAKQVVMF